MKNSTGHKRVRNIQQFFCPSTTQILANSDCLSTLQALYSFHATSYQPYKKSPMTKLRDEILRSRYKKENPNNKNFQHEFFYLL